MASLYNRRSINPGASDSDQRARKKSVTRGKSGYFLSRARLTRVLAERLLPSSLRIPYSSVAEHPTGARKVRVRGSNPHQLPRIFSLSHALGK